MTGDIRQQERLVRILRTRREFVKLGSLAGAVLSLPPWLAACLNMDPTAPATEGSGAPWTPAPIEGYANATSYRPGETAYFQISNNLPYLTIAAELVRVGAVLEPVLGPWRQPAYSQSVPVNASQYGCGWSATFQFVIPSNWRSGVYLIRLWSIEDPRHVPTEILFVVKPANRKSAILYELPVTTYQAYNRWGGTSLYTRDAQGYTHPFVSFDRPYLALGKVSPFRNLPLIAWMEAAGFQLDYCTSVDLHDDPQLRLGSSGYQLLITADHDEYWSWEMRDNVESFIESGGNVAFFGGNTCYWQIRFEPDTRRIACYKDDMNSQRDPAWGWGPEGQRRVTTHWYATPVNRPEEKMTGLSFRYGSRYCGSPLAQVPFHVGPNDHWVFSGLLLGGKDFGQGSVGYETDAACLRSNPDGSPQVGDHNIPIVCEEAHDGQAQYQPPDSIMVLASTDLLSCPGQTGRATMAIYRNNGVVFNAATINWASAIRVSDQVKAVTQNVLGQLAIPFLPSPSLVNLGFEAWVSSSQPDGWLVLVTAPPMEQVFQETSSSLQRGGASSLRINAQTGYARVSQEFSAIGQRYYVVSGWVRSSGLIDQNDGHWLTITLQHSGTLLNFATARYTATDGQWQHVRAYGRVDADGTFPALIKIESCYPGDAWFDALRVDLL